MDYFSANFLLIFAVGVLVITLRARSKNKGKQVLPGKQIAIVGQELEAPLGVDTPLVCLLDDGQKFGDGFQEKTAPALPHNDLCQCQFRNVVLRNYDIFSRTPTPESPRSSDLGSLKRAEARYYKYMLITNHREAEEEVRKTYADLARRVNVAPAFTNAVKKHLSLS
ncbi:MAG: hypothetical protein ABIK68_04595 [bacterium]